MNELEAKESIERNIDKEIFEVITVRRANKDFKDYDGNIAYVFKGKVWMYGCQKNLKHKDRFRSICSNVKGFKEKFEEELNSGWKFIILDNTNIEE